MFQNVGQVADSDSLVLVIEQSAAEVARPEMIGIDLQELVTLGQGCLRIAGSVELQGQDVPQIDVLRVGGQKAQT